MKRSFIKYLPYAERNAPLRKAIVKKSQVKDSGLRNTHSGRY